MRHTRVKKLFFLMIIVIIFINAGNFFDVTEAPKKSDVIICLGGGNGERLNTAIALYLEGYSKSNKLIVTGSSVFDIGLKQHSKFTYCANKGVPKENVQFLKGTSNTMKEVAALKEYLLMHQLKSAIIVSDPPHSRRISMLTYGISEYNKSDLRVTIVSSNVKWWEKKYYWMNKRALGFLVSEALKLPTNYIAYGILKPLGLYGVIVDYFGASLRYIKQKIVTILH